MADFTDEEYREAWSQQSDRQEIIARVGELFEAATGARHDDTRQQLTVDRLGEGGYSSDLSQR